MTGYFKSLAASNFKGKEPEMGPEGGLPSNSSTFLRMIFCTNVISSAFSSYVLALVKNLYKKLVCKNCDEIDT
jgi:hypothetical protein